MLIFSLTLSGLKPASYIALRDAARELGLMRTGSPSDQLILETCMSKVALGGHPADWIPLITKGLGDRGFGPAHSPGSPAWSRRGSSSTLDRMGYFCLNVTRWGNKYMMKPTFVSTTWWLADQSEVSCQKV